MPKADAARFSAVGHKKPKTAVAGAGVPARVSQLTPPPDLGAANTCNHHPHRFTPAQLDVPLLFAHSVLPCRLLLGTLGSPRTSAPPPRAPLATGMLRTTTQRPPLRLTTAAPSAGWTAGWKASVICRWAQGPSAGEGARGRGEGGRVPGQVLGDYRGQTGSPAFPIAIGLSVRHWVPQACLLYCCCAA